MVRIVASSSGFGAGPVIIGGGTDLRRLRISIVSFIGVSS
jgi:hypothetical protein